MPAFGPNQTRDIEYAISNLMSRRMKHVRHGITQDELLISVVKPEHREMLTTITEIARVSSNDSYVEFKRPDLSRGFLGVNVNQKFMIPRYAKQYLFTNEESAPVAQKLDTYLAELRRLGGEHSLVNYVFQSLNDRCSSPMAMRIVWPGLLMALAISQNESLKKKGMELSAARIPKDMPAITPLERRIFADASTCLTMASLLPEEFPPDDGVRVIIHNLPAVPHPLITGAKLHVLVTI